MDKNRVVEKLLKLLALARQGIGGEKENAQRMLDALLVKHGMTLADLDDEAEEPETRWFRPKGEYERQILSVGVALAYPGWSGAYFKSNKRRGMRGYKLTRVQFLEVSLYFSVHSRALAAHLKKQADIAAAAYMVKNDVFTPDSSNQPRPKAAPSRFSMNDHLMISAMLSGIEKTVVAKALPPA